LKEVEVRLKMKEKDETIKDERIKTMKEER
jgi:hypothetical protein